MKTVQDLKEIAMKEAKDAAEALRVAKYMNNEKDIIRLEERIKCHIEWHSRFVQLED